jgi:hypothetical protein
MGHEAQMVLALVSAALSLIAWGWAPLTDEAGCPSPPPS